MKNSALLFVGGVRSGKSGLAVRWAERQAQRRLFLATCKPQDAEMAERVAAHRAERGVGWQCVEETMNPQGVLRALAAARSDDGPGVLLLDCVSMWVANMLTAGLTRDVALDKVAALAAYLVAVGIPIALVSSETGLGLVAPTSLGRQFQNALGCANQMLAGACGTVIFVSCGLPVALKGALPEELC
ncbi:adenosylcobinamide kinase/adenosylcobinamide phosphate guanyltransferase [Deltaproteobacteria bacterium]|nr:adenosylcobinamide kinase/adenosylcobinamide phosphate guanyltransferase [Deltaproteobacteria bacterium]